MSIVSSYNSTHKIFVECLEEIKEIRFTHREIDVAVCIIHNRNEKKITEIIGIMPKTVNAHVASLMQKLRCNNRQYIIDFFEKSGHLAAVRQYYIHLLVESDFKKYLSVIASKYNLSSIITYAINHVETLPEQKQFLKKLAGHLKLANIQLVLERGNIVSSGLTQLQEQADKAGYYIWVLQLIKSLIGKNEIDQISQDFEKDYLMLTSFTAQTNQLNQQLPSVSLSSYKQKYNKKFLFGLLGIIILITGFGINLIIGKRSTKVELALANYIYDTLPKSYKDLLVGNLTREQTENNYSIIKQFDHIIELIKNDKIQEYFDIKTLNNENFINCLYNLNAISSYALFKEHDAEKAEIVLKYAKNLAENYILSRSKLKINFDKLTPTETYTELSIINDLPQMYTITIYFLGRSYIYQKKSSLAEKYFIISKYLGEKLKLYEEILSDIGGLAIVLNDQIDTHIKNGNYQKAKQNIKDCLNIYVGVKKNKREYQLNYRSSNFKPTIIIPSESAHAIIECNKRITRLYTKLIDIADNKEEINHYLDSIYKYFIGNDEDKGALDILTHYELARIVADSYNTIGNLLLKLYDKNIDFTQLRNFVNGKLNLKGENDLEVTYQIFDLAKSLSRNAEFTKADSYDGLIKVCDTMLNQKNITELEQKKWSLKIQEFKDARDAINKELKR